MDAELETMRLHFPPAIDEAYGEHDGRCEWYEADQMDLDFCDGCQDWEEYQGPDERADAGESKRDVAGAFVQCERHLVLVLL